MPQILTPTMNPALDRMAAGAGALLRPGTELCRLEDTERLYRAMPPA